MAEQTTVLVFGATGNTGRIIVEAIIRSKKFHVIVAVRPEAENRPAYTDFKARGVELRFADIANPDDQLYTIFIGVDIVISAIHSEHLGLQGPLIDAAKKAGVKRFIPCDFATPCVRGVRELHDQKLDIREHIHRVGVPFTFIDVGWWMQITMPVLKKELAVLPWQFDASRRYYESDKTTAVTNLLDIGEFVTRIIADPRTLNRHVFCWGEEVSQREIVALAEKYAGQNIPMIKTNEADVRKLIKESRVGNPEGLGPELAYWEYQLSLWFRGDNTVANAVKAEYGSALDARVLYPDFKPRTLEEYASEYYGGRSQPEVLQV